MAVIKVSDLPQKATLDSDDKIVGYSSTGGTSLLLGSAFKAIQTVAETAASNAAASESTVASEKSELESEIATAKTDISTAKMDAVSAITTAQTTATDAIASAKTTAVSAVNSAKSTALSDVSAQQTTSVTAVKSQGDTSVAAVQSAQITATDAITTAHTKAVSAVQAQEAASIQAIEADSVLAGYTKKDELSSLLAAAITQAVTQAVADAKVAAHPVGSYYWSSESTDPSTLFGGTWEQVKDRFIYAAGAKSVGETGGAESHVLTVDEIPAHNHTGTSSWHSFDGYFSAESNQGAHRDGGGVVSSEGRYSTNLSHSNTGDDWGTNYHINVGHNHTFTTNNTGGNAAHSTMPPYLVAYCWKRTA